jgi:alpha-tubulin suppressor-like RCC1 family protein
VIPDESINEDSSSVFVWGNDHFGQMGINSKPGAKGFLKTPKQFIWKVRIKQIACGREHTALVS